jgi:hypothetical protein
MADLAYTNKYKSTFSHKKAEKTLLSTDITAQKQGW